MKGKVTRFSAIIAILFAAHSMIFTQIVPYLTDIGYNSLQRGLILAFYAIVGIFLQVLVGTLCDRFGVLKRFLVIVLCLAAAATVGTFAFHKLDFTYHFVMIGLMGGMIRVSDALMELWIMESPDLYPHFGFIRSFGSLGWAIAALFSGYVVVYAGYVWLSYVSIVLTLAGLFLMIKAQDATIVKSEVAVSFKDSISLFKIKDFQKLTLIFFITYFVYSADNIVVSELILNLGGNAESIGIKWFVQALSELPMLFLVGRLLIRYQSKKLTLFSFAFMAIRFIIYGLAPNVASIILSASLQMLTFPIFLLTQRDLVYKVVPSHLRASSQMIANSFTNGLAAIVTPIVCGALIEVFDVRGILVMLGCLMCVPFIMMARYPVPVIEK